MNLKTVNSYSNNQDKSLNKKENLNKFKRISNKNDLNKGKNVKYRKDCGNILNTIGAVKYKNLASLSTLHKSCSNLYDKYKLKKSNNEQLGVNLYNSEISINELTKELFFSQFYIHEANS